MPAYVPALRLAELELYATEAEALDAAPEGARVDQVYTFEGAAKVAHGWAVFAEEVEA